MTSGLDRRMKLPNLTTEPPLDPPEPVESEPIIFGRHDHV